MQITSTSFRSIRFYICNSDIKMNAFFSYFLPPKKVEYSLNSLKESPPILSLHMESPSSSKSNTCNITCS